LKLTHEKAAADACGNPLQMQQPYCGEKSPGFPEITASASSQRRWLTISSTGDCMDEFMGDKDERNGLSFLFVLEGEENRTSEIRLFSVGIRAFEVRLANEQEWQFLKQIMQAKCKAFGTTMEPVGQRGITVRKTAAPSPVPPV